MNKIIVHGGPGKTGSSAIQNWLVHNQQILFDNGYYYPTHNIDINGISNGNLESVASRSNGRFFIDEEKIKTTLKDFEDSKCEKLLLSSEYFLSFARALHAKIGSFDLIFYIRNPIDQHQSGYNQEVKRHGVRTLYSPTNKNDYFVINAILKLLRSDINLNIKLRPYSNQLFINGSIIDDFLATLNIHRVVTENKTINTSYSFEALEFKRFLNFFPIKEFQIKIDEILQTYNLNSEKYTLIPHEIYQEKLLSLIKLLEELSTFETSGCIKDLIRIITESAKPVYRRQNDEQINFANIINFMMKKDAKLTKQLKKIIEKFSFLKPPLYNFYNAWNIKNNQDNTLDIVKIDDLYEKLRTNSFDNADISKEIAFYLEQSGNIEGALHFMQTALCHKPEDELIINKINEYLKTIKHQSR